MGARLSYIPRYVQPTEEGADGQSGALEQDVD